MGKLEDLVKAAKNGNEEAMLEIVDMFQPIIRKYTRLIGGDEDSSSDLVLALIELIYGIQLDKLKTVNDYVLISYISKSLHHKYIQLSRKSCSVVEHEMLCENDSEYEFTTVCLVASSFTKRIELDDFLKKTLTPKELLCVQLIVIHGYTATEVARELGITKQAVNQCKNRALKKLKGMI